MIAVDGSRVAADASWSANRTSAGLGHQVAEERAGFEEMAAGLLGEHAATDAAEDAAFGDARGDELPRNRGAGPGWIPNEDLATLVGPMITYCCPC